MISIFAKVPHVLSGERLWWSLIAPATVISMFTYNILASIFTLITVGKLYNYHYRQTWRNLIYSDQAILIADDSYYIILIEEISASKSISSYSLPKQMRLERYLERCCCLIRAIRASARGAKPGVAQRRFAVGWHCYTTSWLFKPSWLLFSLLAAGIVLTLGIFLIFITVGIAGQGPRFIASRAVLVAFLDFTLEEPPPWVDQLKPPDETKRPWWWRSVAPLLRPDA